MRRSACIVFKLCVAPLLALGVIGATGCAHESSLMLSEEELTTVPTLNIGDPAPALVVSEWARGKPLGGFAPGNVYVLDFWTSWCGPCIASMPELSELQEKWADRGVQAVAITAVDGTNPRGSVDKVLRENDARIRFRVAIDGGPGGTACVRAYMCATRQTAIPCTFIVDQSARLAWFGHPQGAEAVLQQVVAGTWDLGAARESQLRASREHVEARALVTRWLETQERKDSAGELACLEKLAAMQPKNIPFSPPFTIDERYITLLVEAGRAEEAKAAFAAAMKKEEFTKDAWALADFARAIRTVSPADGDATAARAEKIVDAHEKEQVDATDEWKTYVQRGQRDWDAQALEMLAWYWHDRSDDARAAALMDRSVELSDDRWVDQLDRRKKLASGYHERAARKVQKLN